MIPKIIHNIWIQGYDNLPNENKINYMNIKKLNPDWEFIIWDDEMIKKLLKKYPLIYEIYNKNTYNIYERDSIKSDIARYIIMKEYGGLYFNIEYKCNASIDNLFSNDEDNKNQSKNIIYIANSEINLWNYIYSLQKTKYCSCFMAMEKNHPIWDKVIEKLKQATTKYQINNALDICLQQIENNPKSNTSFPIVLLSKVNGDYQCTNKDTVCYTSTTSKEGIFFYTFLKYIYHYYKQIILFIFAIIIIIFVEYLYLHNAKTFGAINLIPGMPGSAPQQHTQPSPAPIVSQKKKGKSKR
jgi:hypothetical protein